MEPPSFYSRIFNGKITGESFTDLADRSIIIYAKSEC